MRSTAQVLVIAFRTEGTRPNIAAPKVGQSVESSLEAPPLEGLDAELWALTKRIRLGQCIPLVLPNELQLGRQLFRAGFCHFLVKRRKTRTSVVDTSSFHMIPNSLIVTLAENLPKCPICHQRNSASGPSEHEDTRSTRTPLRMHSARSLCLKARCYPTKQRRSRMFSSVSHQRSSGAWAWNTTQSGRGRGCRMGART